MGQLGTMRLASKVFVRNLGRLKMQNQEFCPLYLKAWKKQRKKNKERKEREGRGEKEKICTQRNGKRGGRINSFWSK